jgi:uncharacterized OsmC-like protein
MSIAEAVERASAYLTEHPAEAAYRDAGAHAELDSGLLVTVTGPSGESLVTDMPTGIGGTATAPSPGWFLRAAEASCVASLIGIRAAMLGVRLGSVGVDVDSASDDRGILGLDPAIPAGALSVKIAIALSAPGADPQALREIAAWAVEHCPVTETVQRAVPLEVAVEVR